MSVPSSFSNIILHNFVKAPVSTTFHNFSSKTRRAETVADEEILI